MWVVVVVGVGKTRSVGGIKLLGLVHPPISLRYPMPAPAIVDMMMIFLLKKNPWTFPSTGGRCDWLIFGGVNDVFSKKKVPVI